MWVIYTLLGAAAALLIVLALELLRGSGLTPVKSGESTQLTVTITARENAPELESQLAGLDWLRGEGLLYARVAIVDGGLCLSALERVCLLARRFDKLDISLCENTEEKEK